MTTDMIHDTLPCGIEYGIVPLPHRHVVSFQIMVLAGACTEPASKLGLARTITESIDKGTELRTGRELSDEFDVIGALHSGGVGLETASFSCTVLPSHFDRAVELHAEFLRKPTFPQDVLDINLDLAQQELIALEDDAHSLISKLHGPMAFGEFLGRHPLGTAETLGNIKREDLLSHWQKHFCTGRMLVAVAGAVDPKKVADVLERHFSGFGAGTKSGREPWATTFTPGRTHYDKDLEQEHLAICWPGVCLTDADFAVQQALLGVLSGGMSGRLFTEVREKQGLVYWVGAWQETPRGTGRLFLGASTTPERCDKTYATLLREVDRLGEDLESEELERAITGIVAHAETRGDMTQARCRELSNDLFQRGRPVPIEEKLDRVRAVTIDDIRRFLIDKPHDDLCVMTLGPRALEDAPA